MANSMQTPTEPTIWALRKQGLIDERGPATPPSLFEHLYGYDPIRILGRLPADPVARQAMAAEAVTTSPRLHIINPETRYAVAEIASDLPPDMS